MDSKQRCRWAGSNPLMQQYHDSEWGVPQRDPRMLWEMLMLEGFQAGLSWEIILRKREAFRAAFAGFDPHTVAAFGPDDIERLMANPGIVRARAKIEATIRGARIYVDMQDGGEDFARYCWAFVSDRPIRGDVSTTQNALSATISKALKARGFKFVGPTIAYAWMQAVGLTNDHEDGCFRKREMLEPGVA
jgi:DNA-3-methyladenine glycosylase I